MEHSPNDLVDRIDRPRAAAWIAYDTANSIFPAVNTYAVATWFKETYGELGAFGLTQTGAMVASGLLVPVFGAICDRTDWTRRFLVASTVVLLAGMASMGAADLPMWGFLLAFAVATVGYQTSLVFYNALMPSLGPSRSAGTLSGLGVGLGFVGTLLAAAMFTGKGQSALPIATLLVTTLSIPCLLFVRDRRQTPAASPSAAMARQALGQVATTLRQLPRHRPLMLFLIGNFLLIDVLQTAAFFFISFSRDVFEGSALTVFGSSMSMKSFLTTLGVSLTGAAALFGGVLGVASDRLHPLNVMRLSGLSLAAALVCGALFGGNSPTTFVLSMVLLGAIGMAGLMTAGRKLILILAPPDRVGEFFGLYGITTKMSVIGASVYGLIADAHGPKTALLSQFVPATIGLACLFILRVDSAAPHHDRE